MRFRVFGRSCLLVQLCMGLFVVTPFMLTSFLATPSSAGLVSCTGDCNGDKSVRISELVTMVNIALGRSALSACENGDTNGDGSIRINELVLAVSHALGECVPDIQPRPFKNRVDHPFDPYLAFSATFDGPSWVKFTIRVSEPGVVYFQNSSRTPFHHDFIASTLQPYVGLDPDEIDAVSLHADGQELVLGAVLYSPSAPYEIGIQLVRQDAYSAEEVIRYFDAVRASVVAESSVPFFYFPTFEQQRGAEENREALESAGVRISSTARWSSGDECYALGWAHGRVVFVAGGDIEAAYETGALGPEDILLTDGVPAEIPFVAGVISLAPSTPNSHVAILAADWEVPFVFLALEDSAAAAQALVGREIVMRATPVSPRFFVGHDFNPEECEVRLVDVDGALTSDVENHLRDLKRAPDLALRPFVPAGSYRADVATATPEDIVTIGGKAANYGFLMREIPGNTRPAIAFTFDLWNDYLDQPMPGDVSLRERIAALLTPFPTYPPTDFAALFSALDEIRDLIDDEADFTGDQRQSILQALQQQGFDPLHRIRFRSSTNVEDSDVFTGAGLYESSSGCLADDLDADDVGPSLCEATRDSERGVFRSLRKVFKSFYNDNAFLERLRHRVDEATVGMAVLVHRNFPDETELANGVATLRTTLGPSSEMTVVTQPGDVSVTNPEDGGRPEVVDLFVSPTNVFPNLRQGSDLLPLGATVLQMPEEYVELANLLSEVAVAFGEFHGERQFNIEFEFKKIVDEGLVIKQVRRIPGVTPGFDSTPVLINTPTDLCTFQGEISDVYANYRLKSRWQVDFESGPVEESGDSIYASADHTYVVNGALAQLNGAPASWRDASRGSFDPQAGGVIGLADSWTVGDGEAARVMTLKTRVPTNVGPAFLPIVFPSDLGFTLEAQHAVAVPYRNFDDTILTRSSEQVQLLECSDRRPLTGRYLLQDRMFSDGPIEIDAGYYWPPFPTGAIAGYTAPLDRWVATSISGVVAEPVTLSGYFSQTYRPEHHNFTENFIFDPHLEEGVDPGLIAAWDARGIQALIKPSGFDAPPFQVLTLDGRIVEVADLP